METFEGECQCGAVQYRVTGDSATLFACHCSECQRQSSSAFGMALWIKNFDKEVTGKGLRTWVRKTPSGRELIGEFCEKCGTRLFHQLGGQSEYMSIKPGTLNNTKGLGPVAHIWTSSAQDWIQYPESCLLFSENPDSFEMLFKAWSERRE